MAYYNSMWTAASDREGEDDRGDQEDEQESQEEQRKLEADLLRKKNEETTEKEKTA